MRKSTWLMGVLMVSIVIQAETFALATEGDTTPPESLRKLFAWPGEDEYTTVNWSTMNVYTDSTRKQNFVSRIAAGTVLQDNNGNDEGIHEGMHHSLQTQGMLTTNEDEEALKNIIHGSKKTVLVDGMNWGREGASTHVRLAERDQQMFNSTPNTLAGAIYPLGSCHADGDCGMYGVSTFWTETAGTPTFTETREGDLSLVTMSYEHSRGLIDVVWEIDHARGGLASKSTLSINGMSIYQSEAQIEQVDGVWTPKEISYHNINPTRGERKTYCELKVASVVRNDATLPREGFTPNDLGIGLGFPIYPHKPNVLTDFLYWDGVSIITEEEYQELIYLAGVDPHPDLIKQNMRVFNKTEEEYFERLEQIRSNARQHYLEKHGHEYVVDVFTPTKPGEKDAWDIYVDEFIKKHELKGDVVQEMLSFRDECKRQRDWYRRNHKKYQEESAEKSDDRKLKAMDEHVDRIFNKRLKPGLEKMRHRKPS